MTWLSAHTLAEAILTASLFIWLVASTAYVFQAKRTRPEIDLLDLITGDNGKVSLSKFAQCGAFFVSTWGFVHLTVSGALTEWYYGAYMISWAGANMLNKFMQAKSEDKP